MILTCGKLWLRIRRDFCSIFPVFFPQLKVRIPISPIYIMMIYPFLLTKLMDGSNREIPGISVIRTLPLFHTW